jgi:hypothetical protein
MQVSWLVLGFTIRRYGDAVCASRRGLSVGLHSRHQPHAKRQRSLLAQPALAMLGI